MRDLYIVVMVVVAFSFSVFVASDNIEPDCEFEYNPTDTEVVSEYDSDNTTIILECSYILKDNK